MANKVKRDPNAPKRNLSAYLLYQNAMRDQFRALNPGMTFGQLSKYTSAMYAEMPPAEKEAWVGRAEADKQRYLRELSEYTPAPGYDEKGDAIQAQPLPGTPVVQRSSRGSGGKAERDVNAPKRNMSAYLLYQNAMRDQFKRENPGMTFGQLAKYTSYMYKKLTPEEKETWVQRAVQDKQRYDQEMSLYTPPPGHDARGNLIEEQRPRKRNKRAPKDPDAPKRASGAYVFFTNEMRPMVMKQFPGIKFVEMGRILGERWRALQPDEKSRYEKFAQEDKLRFQMEMQQYTANQAAQQQANAQAQAYAQAQAAVQAGASGGVAVGVHSITSAAAQAATGSMGHNHAQVPVHGQQQGQHGQPGQVSVHGNVTVPVHQQQQFHNVPTPNITPSAMYIEPHQNFYQHHEQAFDPTKYGQLPSHQFH